MHASLMRIRRSWRLFMALAVTVPAGALAQVPWDLVVPASGPIKCGTPAVIETHALLPHMPADVREQAEELLTRPPLDSYVDTAHFRIHYSTSGSNMILGWPNTAYRDSVASACEYGYNWYVAHGWPVPPPDGGAGGNDKIDCYVDQLSGVYGVTYPESPSGYYPQYPSSVTAYFVIDNDYAGFPNAPYGAMHVTVAHEYHHVIQMGMYGQDGAAWFMENTSTFMEDELYDGVNDNYQYMGAYFGRPWTGLRTMDGQFEYACFIWPTYLKDRWSHSLVYRIWDQIGRTLNVTTAFDAAISATDPSYDWDRAVAEWARWNVFTGARDDGRHYAEGASYPYQVAVDGDVTTYPQTDLHPAATKMPQGLGTNFTRFRPQAGSTDNKISIDFTALNACDNGNEISFVRKLAGQDVFEEYVVPVDGNGHALFEVTHWDRTEFLFMVVEMKRQCGSGGKDFVYSARTSRVMDVAEGTQPTRIIRLDQNAPNPFNPSTTIRYAISGEAPVHVDVFDVAGRHVRTLVDAVQPGGEHQVKWSGDDDAGRRMPAGLYLYAVRTGNERAIRKMIMVP